MSGFEVEHALPRVLDRVLFALDGRQLPLLASHPPPMVHQFVPRYAQQPSDADVAQLPLPDGGHRGHERLGGQVLRYRDAATPHEQVSVYLRQGDRVDRDHRITSWLVWVSADTPSSLAAPALRTLRHESIA
jgi:hypothetical protein